MILKGLLAIMSDSEDTDSLLSIASPAGLTNFLGLTVEQMSTHINSLTSCQPEESKNGTEESKVPSQSRDAILSQLAEWSDSDNDANEDAKSDTGSEASTASTNSITLLMAPDSKDETTKDDVEVIDTATAPSAPDSFSFQEEGDFPDISNGIPETSTRILEFKYDKYKAPNYGVRISPGFGAQGLDFLRPSPNSGWRYLPGWEHEPQLVQRAPNFRTPGGYKPPENPRPPRDLSDAEIQEETRRMYAFPDDEDNEEGTKSSETIPKENTDSASKVTESNEIKSGLKGEGDSRAKSEIEDQIIPNPSLPESLNVDSKIDDESSLTGGKFVKRKLFAAGDNPGSIPDLGFGLRDFDKLEVKEQPVVPSHAWTSGSSGQENKKKNRRDKPNVSFAQFRDENDLEISPIKAAYLEKNAMSADISRCLPRYRPSGNRNNVVKSPSKKVNLLELDLLWRDIRCTKERMEQDIEKSSARLKALSIDPLNVDQHLSERTGQLPGPKQFISQQQVNTPETTLTQESEPPSSTSTSQTNKEKKVSKSILKSKHSRTKNHDSSKATDVSFDFSGATDDFPSSMSGVDSTLLPTDLDTIELSSILSAAHLKASEFEEILEKIDEFSDETFEEIGNADEEIETILTKLEVSDWAKSGANEYMQKFHEEKFKREHCEREIASLQKSLLKLQEDAAVREKMSNKKDVILVKMSKAWSEVTKQWQAHELQSKDILDKLQKNQKVLTETLCVSKQRIEDYEKELASAVELAATFKSKLENLETARCDQVGKLESENDVLKERFSGLESTLQSIKVEKNAAVRALSESQKQLDERIVVHEEMQGKLSGLEVESQERQKELQKIAEQKQVLEEHLQSVSVQKDTLENELVNLTDQLRIECEEKERLKLNQHLEIERNLKEESERLHSYYNLKLQEAIQLQSTKMIATEAQILENHQRQLMGLEKDMMRRIRECKNRCLSETNKMKNKYESEIKTLREDVAQKQQFISTISHQLQSYVRSDRHHDTEKVRTGQVFMEGSKLNMKPNQRNKSDLSLASSTDSTADSNIEFRVHSNSRLKKADGRHVLSDEGNSSVDNFHPSKLSRYNTSTPNSVLEVSPKLKVIKGWRELPNIQHLLNPDEQPGNTHVLTENTKLHKLFPTSSESLLCTDACEQRREHEFQKSTQSNY
ncbi:unnamed protein product [Allacma fusca]|uniref:Uncharacterized protein n=1 Tax=Allacma fusca TaxID=39272 RepID=A0A8J2L901_9HEXA|nr:unnamed protein product [Allacma fusca]